MMGMSSLLLYVTCKIIYCHRCPNCWWNDFSLLLKSRNYSNSNSKRHSMRRWYRAAFVNTERNIYIKLIVGYLGYLLFKITIILSTVCLSSVNILYSYIYTVSLITNDSQPGPIDSYISCFF